MGTTSHKDLVAANKKHTLASWTAQRDWNPNSMVRGEGIYFWDGDGKRYVDWSSQLVNVNVGHGHPHVIKTIQEQAEKICYAFPAIATDVRARLAEMLREITPDGLGKSFFTLGGADAVENAMKIARLNTGRQKILTRFRSYHGSTFGAMMATGGPRRLANEPGVPWVIHFHGPYAYRNPIYRDLSEEQGDAVVADLLEQTVLYEDPKNIAAIMLEGYSGSSGILQGGEIFWRRVQEICDTYDILLIIDEVMSGFGRTGRWFGVDHYPYVKPDLMTLAKGLTSGYVPLGAVVVADEIAEFFEENTLWCGLTYSAHALGCAAGIANIEVYEKEHLIERSETMGKVLSKGLKRLAEKHACVGEIRGAGLHQVIELVKNKETREPMSGFNMPLSEPMQKVASSLRKNGLSTLVRWNWIFNTPPLVISEDQIDEALAIIDKALDEADAYCE
jgi:taurine--2-oxoglutarate transaminase